MIATMKEDCKIFCCPFLSDQTKGTGHMITQKQKRIRGTILALTGGTAWGFSGTCGQYIFAHSDMASGTLAAIRMLGAGGILLLFCVCRLLFSRRKDGGKDRKKQEMAHGRKEDVETGRQGKGETLRRGESEIKKGLLDIWKQPKDAVRLVLFALFGLMFSQYAYLTAISYSNSGTATVFQNTGIIMVMALSCLFGRRWPKKNEVAAAVLTLVGVVLIATHGNLSGLVISRAALTWGVLAAIALVSYTLLPGKLLDRWGTPLVNGYAMLLGGIVMGVKFHIWQEGWDFSRSIFMALIVMIVFGTVISFTFYMQGVADVGPVKASMLACIEPVVATTVSALWLKTEFAAIDLIGFVLIIGACLLVSVKGKEDREENTYEKKRESCNCN
ncbi:MAG: EamA family transporter [Eubacteriales bacterium]|nr:EamA family transporter [Eubacteriales bacterium]